jgi:hypothetical protein
MNEANFECKFCHKVYVREDAYMKHECKQMKRAAEIKTAIGQSAYLYYSKWMNMNKRKAPTIEVFTTSRYYNAFIKFAEYVKRINIHDVDAFLSLVVERDLAPTMWTNDKVYVLYIEYLDRKVGPMRQANTTIQTFFNIADAAECDVSEIFDYVSPAEVIQMLRQRRLSPWLLLNSGKFKQMFVACTPEQRSIFEDLIRPMFWKIRFQKHPETVDYMKRYISELGL